MLHFFIWGLNKPSANTDASPEKNIDIQNFFCLEVETNLDFYCIVLGGRTDGCDGRKNEWMDLMEGRENSRTEDQLDIITKGRGMLRNRKQGRWFCLNLRPAGSRWQQHAARPRWLTGSETMFQTSLLFRGLELCFTWQKLLQNFDPVVVFCLICLKKLTLCVSSMLNRKRKS